MRKYQVVVCVVRSTIISPPFYFPLPLFHMIIFSLASLLHHLIATIKNYVLYNFYFTSISY